MSVLIALANAPLGKTATLACGKLLKFRAAIQKSPVLHRTTVRARQLVLSTPDDRTRLGAIGLAGYRAPYGGWRWWLSCPEVLGSEYSVEQ